ncbi:MAG: hypothetical protein AAGJ80_09500, partial [Cyanobacteria bacterium J06553_1]
LKMILSTVGWGRASMFSSFYDMPVSSQDAFGAVVLAIMCPVCCHQSGGVIISACSFVCLDLLYVVLQFLLPLGGGNPLSPKLAMSGSGFPPLPPNLLLQLWFSLGHVWSLPSCVVPVFLAFLPLACFGQLSA